MVSYYHKVPDFIVLIAGSGSIGYEDILNPHRLHNPDSHSHLFHRVTFIVVESTLHRNHIFSSHLSAYEIALVAYCGGNRKSRYAAVGDYGAVSDSVGKFSQSASQDDSDLGRKSFWCF